jgi:hypothetical protein
MAKEVGETEVVLRFWSKESKRAFLGQFCDGWGENMIQFGWNWKEGVSLDDATHLEVQSFYDPSVGEKDEHYRRDWWNAPSFEDDEEVEEE